MSDPALALQIAIVERLKADAAVAALVGPRIFDAVPQQSAYPLIGYGADQVLATEHDGDCFDGSETLAELHVFSRAAGQAEAKRIAAAVRAALARWTPALADILVDDFRWRSTRYLRPDGSTTQAVLTFQMMSHADD